MRVKKVTPCSILIVCTIYGLFSQVFFMFKISHETENSRLQKKKVENKEIKTNKTWTSWNDMYAEILQKISLPEDHDHRFILPRQLKIQYNEIDRKVIKHGVFMFAASPTREQGLKYAEEEILPAILNFQNVLQIPNAKERSARRARGDFTNGCDIGFAILLDETLLQAPSLKGVISFFDAVFTPSDLPQDYPIKGWLAQRRKWGGKRYNRGIKVHSIASAPFDITLTLDFDSRPCQANFVQPLLSVLGDADIALSNKELEMDNITDYRHWMGEHNSALLVLNMKSIRTRALLGLNVVAAHKIHSRKPTGDQIALMVALRAMSKPSLEGRDTIRSNMWVKRNFMNYNNTYYEDLGPLQHIDIPHDVFCRKKIQIGREQTCDLAQNSCIIKHK